MRSLPASLPTLLLSLSCAAPVSGPLESPRIQRVERGLLPPILIEGEPVWTLAERMRALGVPGVSVAVIDGFDVAWTKAWGVANRDTGEPVTTDTLFQASSMSKPITAALTLELAEEGRLALEDDVRELLTSWSWPDATTPDEALVLTRLLSHSAGLCVPGSPGFAPGEPLPTLLQTLAGAPPANTRPLAIEHPAGEFCYSGGGYMLLQQALEDRTREPFAALARELVLQPLSMTRSTFAQPLPPELAARAASGHDDDGAPLSGNWRVHVDLAAAGLWTTAEDYARFVCDLLRGLNGQAGTLLTAESARRMIEPVTPLTGLGVFRVGPGPTRYLGHGGANWGYNSLFLAHPESGQGIVVLTNFQGNDVLCWELVRSVAREYGWPEWLPEVLARAHPDAGTLEQLCGRYRTGADGVLTIERAGDRLRATPLLEDSFELVPVEGGVFMRIDQGREYRFELDPSGSPRACMARWNGAEWEAEAPRIAAEERVPSELLEEGEIERGLEALAELARRDADDPALARGELEARGRALLARGSARAAAALLEFAAESSPWSASLADARAAAWLATGENERARAACEAVLAALETDFVPTASWRVLYRQRAEERLRTLTAQATR